MAAFIPNEGESLAGISGDTAPSFVTRDDNLGTLGITDPGQIFYNDCSPDDTAHALGLLVAHPIAAQHTGIECRRAALRAVPVTYIVCEEDMAIPAAVQDMMIGRVRKHGVEVQDFRIKGGHSPFLSMPQQGRRHCDESVVIRQRLF
ncbi:unnamed protein product [Discula destructiva]